MVKNFKKYSQEEIQNLINESTSISEVLKKMGYPGNGWYHVEFTKYLKDNKDYYNTSTLVGRSIKRHDDSGIPKKFLSEVLCKNSTYNSNKLKKRLIYYGIKEYKCENPKCGISEWCDEPIVLQLHHINGNHYDNRLENLVLLCPNCHSQTSNYSTYKNKGNLNEILSEVAKEKANLALQNLIEFEKGKKEEIIKNRKKLINSYNKIKDKKIKLKKYCEFCGKEINGNGKKFCSVECMIEYERQNSGYDIEEVIEKSKSCHSMIELAQYFNVTTNAIKNRLKKDNSYEKVKQNLNNNKKNYTILQYTTEGIFIREWPNAIEASKELNINKNNIYFCCNGKQKTCGGFIWKFKYE